MPTKLEEESLTIYSKKRFFTRYASHHYSYDATMEKRPIMFFVKFTNEFVAIILGLVLAQKEKLSKDVTS